MLKLFIDFDNTITVGDVGDALFRFLESRPRAESQRAGFLKFGGEICSRYDTEYRESKISAKECLRSKSAACSAIDSRELDVFIDSQMIDSTFPAFVQFCKSRGLECIVVSDGFDYYIKRLLQRYGLDDLPCFSNEVSLELVESPSHVKLVPSFPYDDEECTRCACCKRNIMLTHSGEGDVLVYIGDGYSDQCPVQYADIVFAKPELQAFCQRNNISYFEYRSFSDVQARMEQLLRRKRIHKRQAAEANRQALFLAG